MLHSQICDRGKDASGLLVLSTDYTLFICRI